MTREEYLRKQRQEKLANLFFEMGMDLDLVEQMSGIDKRTFLSKRIKDNYHSQLTTNNYDSSIYVENKNSY
jgi:hypothetical protein